MLLHLVLDGVFDGALGVGLDIWSTARRLNASRALEQRVVSVDGRSVRTHAGRPVAVDGALRVPRPGDVIVLAGLGAATDAQLTERLARVDVQRLLPLLRRAKQRKVLLAASCSSTFVLGAAGVLDGGEATTTGWLDASFRRRFPRVQLSAERMVVASRGVFTAGAALGHADLMLALLARVVSPKLAHLVARYLLLDARDSQARFMVREHLRSDDPLVRKLETFVGANVGRQLSLRELSRAAATSPRTLARRLASSLGTTPLKFVQRVRMTKAAHLLETTKENVDRIAERVGYADAAAFRRVFRRELGDAPRSLRTSPSPLAGRGPG